jgi:hypothetical protein
VDVYWMPGDLDFHADAAASEVNPPASAEADLVAYRHARRAPRCPHETVQVRFRMVDVGLRAQYGPDQEGKNIQVQHLLLRFGIQSTVHPCHQGAHWRLRVPNPWWRRFLEAVPIWGAKRGRLEEIVQQSRGGVSVIGLPAFTARLRQALRTTWDPDGFGTRVAPYLYVARNARTGQPRAADVAARLGWTKFQFDRLSNKGTNTICPAAFRAFCAVLGVTGHDWIWSRDIFWDRITSITPAAAQEVYSLHVEPSRNFVASGVIVDCPGPSSAFVRRLLEHASRCTSGRY